MISTSLKIALVGVLGALASLKSVAAHGHVIKISIDGKLYAGSNPSNLPELGPSPIIGGDNASQEFKDFSSNELATNAPSGRAADLHAAVSGGSVVTWTWDQWPTSHLGPITTYMAACPSTGCKGFDGNAASDWFKVSEYGYDGTAWAAAYIIDGTPNTWEVTMPTDLASGYYLIRHEIIAMHSTGSPQAYPIVFWAYLTSSGSTVPTVTGSFPAMYATDDDALTWNIYNQDNTLFKVPGVALYDASLTSNSGPASAPATGTFITTDAGPGAGSAAPAPVASGSTSSSAPASASASAGAIVATPTVVGGGVTASGSSASSSAVAVPTAAPISAPISAPSAGDDDCDGEPVTVTITVPKTQPTSPASDLSPPSDDDYRSDEVVTVTVTAGAAAVTQPAGGTSGSASTSATGGNESGSAAYSVGGGAAPAASSTEHPYWTGGWGSGATATAPSQALATGGTSCDCPATRYFVERDATPLIEEVYTRSGNKFLTRGLVFTSELAARDACGADCDFISVSRRKVSSRWGRAH